MDRFESALADWANMIEAEKKHLEKESEGLCLCPACPTYNDCEKKKELSFCFAGKSGCITSPRGCHCPGCPIKEDFGLANIYYCLNGKEADIRKGE